MSFKTHLAWGTLYRGAESKERGKTEPETAEMSLGAGKKHTRQWQEEEESKKRNTVMLEGQLQGK